MKKKLWLVFLPLVAASCSGAAYSVWYFSEKDKVEVSNNVDVDVNGFVDVGDIKVYLKESPSSSGTLAGTDIDFSTLSELTSFLFILNSKLSLTIISMLFGITPMILKLSMRLFLILLLRSVLK